jgi:predicted glycoside hydrolase/deacetylase ChbG (UPF0249 family)
VTAAKTLVVNADDFGLTNGVNRGIIEAHCKGIVTSTTTMVRQPAARDAAALSKLHPALGVGLHVDLGEWAFTAGEWVALYEVVDTDDADAVSTEVERQVATFWELFGRPPTHLDSHQHVHNAGPARDAVTAAAARLGVPVRAAGGVRYVGDFYGQLSTGEPYHGAITVEALVALLLDLPAGTSELACHPGYAEGLAATGTMYVAERETELRALCDPRVVAAIEECGIELVTFAGIA